MANEKIIKEKISKEYSPIYFELVNESHKHRGHPHNDLPNHGVDSHFKLLLVSSVFEGISRVQRQQLIHKTLAPELAGTLHALSMKLLSPKEWEALPKDQRQF